MLRIKNHCNTLVESILKVRFRAITLDLLFFQSAAAALDAPRITTYSISPMPDCLHTIHEVFDHQKADLLVHLLSGDSKWSKTVIFVRSRETLHSLNSALSKNGIPSEALSGNKKPELREQALEDLGKGITRVLLSTEAMLRDHDLSGIERVIQYDVHERDRDYLERADAATAEITTFISKSDMKHLSSLEALAGTKLESKKAEGFAYDSQPRHVRVQPKKGQSNRTKSKPLQNKKPKLKNKGPRRKTGRTRKR